MIDAYPRPKKIIVLTGEKTSGKTSFLQGVIRSLHDRGETIGGLVQLGLWKKEERYGFDLLDIQTGQTVPLCRTDAPDAGIVAGPFKFYPEAVRSGNRILSGAISSRCSILVIDEIGKLEISGSGWASSLSTILQLYTGMLLIIIRTPFVEEVCEQFSFSPTHIANAGSETIDTVASLLLSSQP